MWHADGKWRPGRRALLALILLSATQTHAQSSSVPQEQFFRMDWQRRVESQGHVIVGYLHNHYLHPITDVQVRVEVLDASGQPIGEAVAAVAGEIRPGDRGYFAASVPAGGAAFGVSVHSFAFAPVESP